MSGVASVDLAGQPDRRGLAGLVAPSPLTVFACTRDLIPPTAAALWTSRRCWSRRRPTRPTAGRTVTLRPPTPEGRAPRCPDPGPQHSPTGPHAAASYAALSRTPPPVRGRAGRDSQTQHEIAAI